MMKRRPGQRRDDDPTDAMLEEVAAIRRGDRHMLTIPDAKNLLTAAEVEAVKVAGRTDVAVSVNDQVTDGRDERMTLAALRVYRSYVEIAEHRMTAERATVIRQLRHDGHTYGGVAEETHADWGSDAAWQPPWNRIAGRALCAVVAAGFGEDPMGEPWN